MGSMGAIYRVGQDCDIMTNLLLSDLPDGPLLPINCRFWGISDIGDNFLSIAGADRARMKSPRDFV